MTCKCQTHHSIPVTAKFINMTLHIRNTTKLKGASWVKLKSDCVLVNFIAKMADNKNK